MKQNIIIGLLALMLAGLFTITKAPAQGNSKHDEPLPHSIIMLVSTYVYHYSSNNQYIVDGLKIDWFEADQYAPTISRGDRLADTIAKCMDLGYKHEVVSGQFHILKR